MPSRALASFVLASVLSAATAAPSHAERWTHRDPARDVYQQDVGRAPAARQGDITHVSMDFQRRRFVLEVMVRELHAEQYSYLDLYLSVPHPGGRSTDRDIKYYFSIDDGRDVGATDPRTGYPVDCRPITASRSYDKGTLRISVPQDCLGRRATGLHAATFFYEARRDLHGGPYIYTDDGLRKGPHNPYAHSPLLTRG